MLQESFWKIFEDTGSVDSYIFYREMAERNNAEEQVSVAAEVVVEAAIVNS